MEVDRADSIPCKVVAAHVDLGFLIIVNVNTEHVVLNGTLLVKTWDEQLSARVLARR